MARINVRGMHNLHKILMFPECFVLDLFIYSYKNLKQELKTVKVNSEKHTQVYGMYRAV